ncbi:DUF4157 domain-containing protein [Zobellia sp. 1_MG-2023]|uniref:eCIS core domain-containing protein n=1 Tax=Zobellia sp. 1_MG-2023 TaxID=3062626 RepID=UPI0026E185CD|nr:DUF4157 domain-containing protein [Zobellia sp. 1_MG-2023]MDO6818881.1 DUF4157 domain-containing protein [Zobellia sp. 1_MG-2023]
MGKIEKNTQSCSMPQLQMRREPFFTKEGQAHFFSKSNNTTSSFFSPATVQPKLSVGQPNDKYEVEADTMADKVVQKIADGNAKSLHTTVNNSIIQPKCDECEQEENMQEKELEEIQRKPIFESNEVPPEAHLQTKCGACEEKEKIQSKSETVNNNNEDLTHHLQTSKGEGTAMTPTVQEEMEGAFGRDFSHVRVHTGNKAIQMNSALNSQAFAYGSDIYFNQGKYDTTSVNGKHLLAHELTHTVQQQPMLHKRIQRTCNPRSLRTEVLRDYFAGVAPANREAAGTAARGLTNAQKRALRQRINSCAVEGKDEIISSNNVSIGSVERRFRTRVNRICDSGIRNIRRYRTANRQEAIERTDELAAREEDLIEYKNVIRDDLLLWYNYQSSGGRVQPIYDRLRDIGNPSIRYSAESIGSVRYSVFVLRIARNQGAEALIIRIFEDILYRGLWFKKSDLRTTDPSSPGAGGNSTGGGDQGEMDPEEMAELAEFYQEVEDSGGPVEDQQPSAELLERIRQMSDEEKRAFMEFYRNVATDTDEPTTLNEALERYQNLSEADREIMRTNRELENEPEESSPVSEEGRLRLNLSNQRAVQGVNNAETANSTLAQIQANLRTNHSQETGMLDTIRGANPFGEEMYLFYNEMAILDGLLIGAGQKSPQIREVAISLRRELDNFDQMINREMMEILAELGILQAFTLATEGLGLLFTGARIATLVRRIDKLRRLYIKVRQVLGIFQTVTDVIQLVRNMGEVYNTFKSQFEQKLTRYRAIQRRMDEVDSSDGLDEEFEELQEEITELVQTQLDGQLGDLLENFYITEEDAQDEERLMQILMNIPAGISELQRLSGRYRQAESSENPSESAEVLTVMAVNVGSKLYPLVGFLANLANEELSEMNREVSTAETLQNAFDNVLNGRGRRGRGRDRRSSTARSRRRGENRGFFNRFRPRRYRYATGSSADAYGPGSKTLWGALNRGMEWMNREFEGLDSNHTEGSFKGAWTKWWFRRKARQKLRELNRIRIRWRVSATERGGSRRPVANQIPPRFRIRWQLGGRRNLSFKLKLNPVSRNRIMQNKLVYTDFSGTGIRFNTGDRDRKRALEKWLEDQDYLIQTIGTRNFIRHNSRGAGPGMGARRRFLQIESGMIKQDQRLRITKLHIDRFIGREISDNQDLPEGFLMQAQGIRRRRGQRTNLRAHKLGLDEDGKLTRVEREGSYPVVQTRTQIQEQESEPITDPVGMVDQMFEEDNGAYIARPDFNVQRRSRTQWSRLIRTNTALRNRPTKIRAILGNVRYARAFGDSLRNRHLPMHMYGDDKGHLIAKRFGGNDSYNNLVPMNSRINRVNRRGTWYFEESSSAREFRRGHKQVEIEIQITYPNRRTRRPSRFSIKKRLYHPRENRSDSTWSTWRRMRQ